MQAYAKQLMSKKARIIDDWQTKYENKQKWN